jgi:quercetin dioxygenase-like cupin family protein
MGRSTLLFVALLVAWSLTFAQQATVTPLFQADMNDLQDQEGVMVTVEYPPGVGSGAHRHNAYVFVYVLEGSVIMQVEGGERTTLVAGQTFYETPGDIHTVSMNASETEPAKILALLVKPKGAPVTVPIQ